MQTVLIVVLLVIIFSLIGLSYIIATFGLTGFLGAPYVGTPKRIAREMLEFVEFKEGETITDIGSGTGTILIVAAKEFGAKKAIGYDINPFLIWISRFKARRAGVADRVTFKRANFYKTDFEATDVLGLYLLAETLERLQYKLKNDFNPNARIVSRGFAVPEKEPLNVMGEIGSRIYLYRVGDLA